MFELVQYKHNIDIANNLDLCVPTIQKSHSFQQKPAEVQLLGFWRLSIRCCSPGDLFKLI